MKKPKVKYKVAKATILADAPPTPTPPIVFIDEASIPIPSETPAPHNCVLVVKYAVVDGFPEYTVAKTDGSKVILNMVELDLRAATLGQVIVYLPQVQATLN